MEGGRKGIREGERALNLTLVLVLKEVLREGTISGCGYRIMLSFYSLNC